MVGWLIGWLVSWLVCFGAWEDEVVCLFCFLLLFTSFFSCHELRFDFEALKRLRNKTEQSLMDDLDGRRGGGGKERV